jgi:epoxyqueuosine reductase
MIMDVTNLTRELFSRLEAESIRGRAIAIQHLPDLHEDIEDLHKQGLLDENFYQEWLTGFRYTPPENLPEAKSIIVVAVPQPQTQVTFSWKGEIIPLVVPPTYLHSKEVIQRLESLLKEILAQYGYQATYAVLPLKLLGARSGLSRFGRNNISYVDGIGSFYRIAAFYSDLPCQEDSWQNVQLMERCQQCSACIQECPTRAIGDDRFLLYAERCLTYLNEKPGDVAFPSWVDYAWHNCLVGCLFCQKICPQNKKYLNWIEVGVKFSEEETLLMLQRVPLDQLSSNTADKLAQDNLVDFLDVIPRNLEAILIRDGKMK